MILANSEKRALGPEEDKNLPSDMRIQPKEWGRPPPGPILVKFQGVWKLRRKSHKSQRRLIPILLKFWSKIVFYLEFSINVSSKLQALSACIPFVSSIAPAECASAERIGAGSQEPRWGIPRSEETACPRGSRPKEQPVQRGNGTVSPGG